MRFRVIFILTVTALIASFSLKASAMTVCHVPDAPLNAFSKSFSINGSRITSSFTVTGVDCSVPVTLSIWKSPSLSGNPVNDQKLFDSVTTTFGPGQHVLTLTLPDCFFQADLLEGSNPTAADGTANYDFQNGQVFHGPLRDFTVGGDKICATPAAVAMTVTPTPTPTPQATTVSTNLPNTGNNAFQILGAGITTGLMGTLFYQIYLRRFGHRNL